MGLVHGLLFKNLLSDIYGSRVASVVVLPLSLAFAVASELGAIAGWYWAIFVGFIGTLAGGTSAQVSGSTGPMIVVLLTTILVDTIIAIAVGIVSTSLFFMKRMAEFSWLICISLRIPQPTPPSYRKKPRSWNKPMARFF